MPNYNPNSIWESKEKQYTYEPNNSPITPNPTPPQKSFNDDSEPPSFFHRHRLMFFGIGLVLAVGLVGLVFYLLLPPATPNIAISFSEPESVAIGEPFPFTVTVSNESKSVLQNGELNIILPAGISFVGQDPDQRVMTESVGTLSSQTINPPQTVQLIVTGNAGTTQTITTKLTYQTAETAAAQYETDASTGITVGSETALSIAYTAPSSIFSGQNFDLAVNYQNNSTDTLQGVQLQMQYPPAYTFVRTNGSPAIDSADTTWDLGNLGPNATGTLVITGNITGPQSAQYQLTGNLSATFSGQNYPVSNPQEANFTVTPSPLSLVISLNNSSTYVSKAGDNLNYTLTYTNNSNVALQTMNISAALVGQMYDFTTVNTDGSFDSQNNTITWYTATTPSLSSLAPGQSGSVAFSINTKPLFPIRLPSDKDYSLKVTAEAESPTVPSNTAGTNTVSIDSLNTKIGGQIALTSEGYFNEASTSITNTGPYPPKVNQPTEYTIHWNITNYSTDATSVTVSAYLESGTTFTGQATSTIASSTPSYNASTGLVTWTIPVIAAGTGIIGTPAEAIFQVSNTPASNEVNQTVTLLGQTTLTATDEFTGQTLQSSADPITTKFPDDPTVANQTGVVTQ